ncbi:hypothetical protein JW877_04850, partial [bacterium]|nr:hypothetical protein [bacterium]
MGLSKIIPNNFVRFISFCILIISIFGAIGSVCPIFGAELLDTSPPYFQNWNPSPGAVNIPPNTAITVDILDCRGEDISGVNPETIHLLIVFGADTLLIPHSSLGLTPIDCAGYSIFYNDPLHPFPECTEIKVGVYAEDFAGLIAGDHISFTTGGCSIPPDSAGPVAELITPLNFSWSACPDQNIVISIEDPDGINPETILLDVNGFEYGVDHPALTWYHMDAILVFDQDPPWPDGITVNVSLLTAEDMRGNPLTDAPLSWNFGIDLGNPYFQEPLPGHLETLTAHPEFISVVCLDDYSGINVETLQIQFNAGLWHSYSEPHVFWDPYTNRLTYSTLGYPPYTPGPEGSVRVCVRAADNPDYCDENWGNYCWTFYVVPEEEDSCPPLAMDWHPARSDTCYPPDINIHFNIVDPQDPGSECPVCSGINLDSLRVTLYNYGTLYELYPGEGLIIDPAGPCNLFVMLDSSYYSIEGSHAMITVYMMDNAGNSAVTNKNIYFCATLDDIWAPCFSNWYPAEGCLEPGESLGVTICDVCEGALYSSGVDLESIEAVAIHGTDTLNILDYLTFYPNECGGYSLSYTVPRIIVSREAVEVCIYASDFSGNRSHDCHIFNYCDSLPPDCSPLLLGVTPHVGAWEVPANAGIAMDFGPAGDFCPEMCWDTLSFSGWLEIIHDGSIDTVELNYDDVEFWFGFYPVINIEYHHPEPWPSGATVHGIWEIADCAENYADGMVYFHVEALDTTDTWPPCFSEWFPIRECLEPGDILGVSICDVCEG